TPARDAHDASLLHAAPRSRADLQRFGALLRRAVRARPGPLSDAVDRRRAGGGPARLHALAAESLGRRATPDENLAAGESACAARPPRCRGLERAALPR